MPARTFRKRAVGIIRFGEPVDHVVAREGRLLSPNQGEVRFGALLLSKPHCLQFSFQNVDELTVIVRKVGTR
jgi:hypothetical protein